jgi:CHASE2 domain-containing sensor protein
MSPRKRKNLSWNRTRRVISGILLALAGTYVLSRLGTLHGLERLALDVELRAGSKELTSIALVNITDADYGDGELFDGRSPLDQNKLHDLIGAIARSRPAVIAVDIDTSHHQFQALNIDSDWPPVIWERDVSTANGIHEGDIVPLDVLGGRDPGLNANSGIPALLDDPGDKVTRLYTRCVETRAGSERSFVYAVSAAYRNPSRQGELQSASPCTDAIPDSAQPFYIRYSLREGISLYEADAAQVLHLSDKKENGGLEESIPAFSKKIVLLGGTYGSCDRHFTPIGTLPGFMVIANAIQTEVEGQSVKAYPLWQLFILEFLAGALLVSLLHLFPFSSGKALVWGLVATAVLALAFSFLPFRTISRWASFAPTLLAVLIFEIYENARHESILRAVHWKGKKEPTHLNTRS